MFASLLDPGRHRKKLLLALVRWLKKRVGKWPGSFLTVLISISVPLTPTITTGGDTLLRGHCRWLLPISRANVITVKMGGAVLCAGGCPPTTKKVLRRESWK